MKVKKKTALIASFTLGTLIFAGTAFADITSKSGYEQLKDGLKVAAEKASSEFESFTLDTTFVIKDNGKVLRSDNHVEKIDRKANATETINTSEGANIMNGSNSYYSYSDSKIDIRHASKEDTYYVTEYTEAKDQPGFSNPFKEDEAEDVERIADAVVGSLKDHVIVKENPDGSKELTGSLSEMQIPALVNAVASFQLKQEFNNRGPVQNDIPHLTQDIFVKEVKGSATINKDGVLENILGTALISGKDDQGQLHEITIEMLGKLTDINSTKVTKPDLTDKKVIKNVNKPTRGPELTNPEKFLGTYKNDIILEKDGKFVKAGERFLEITQIDNRSVSGRYHETIKPGFEDLVTKTDDFTFNGSFDKGQRNARFEISNGQGGKMEGNLYLDDYMGKVNFHLNQPYWGGVMFDSNFSPVLE